MTEAQNEQNISWSVLKNQVTFFSAKLEEALVMIGIFEESKILEIDHICIRLRNSSSIDELKIQLAEVGQIISSVNVSEREISIIQLNEPLNLGYWQTQGVELPHPKPNHTYEDGWEHVEFVFNKAENTMDGVRKAFMDTFPKLDPEKLKDEYSYSESEPHAERDQLPNPTIGIKVNGVGIKFHAKPIQEVVGFNI